MITDKFFPLMFKKPTEDNFWADYSFAMQVLNFYLYLLMRDKHNLVSGNGYLKEPILFTQQILLEHRQTFGTKMCAIGSLVSTLCR